jgi:hypothetical protein
MSRVKVHPHRSLVKRGIEACVSVTPSVKGGTAYYKGTVELRSANFVIHRSGVERAQVEQVRNVHAWCVGELLNETEEQRAFTAEELRDFIQVTYHFNVGRFMTVEKNPRDVTDLRFKKAIFVGADFYVSDELIP